MVLNAVAVILLGLLVPVLFRETAVDRGPPHQPLLLARTAALDCSIWLMRRIHIRVYISDVSPASPSRNTLRHPAADGVLSCMVTTPFHSHLSDAWYAYAGENYVILPPSQHLLPGPLSGRRSGRPSPPCWRRSRGSRRRTSDKHPWSDPRNRYQTRRS